MEQLTMHIIANIHSDFPTKFGIPRQSGLVEELTAKIVFTPDYRAPEAVRGLSLIHILTLDTAKAVVDLAAGDPGHHGLIFFGGEPLLQRQLIYDTVAYAQSLRLPGKFHYKITTNGTLLDREFLDFSQKHQVFIALSHDGIAQDVNRIGPEDSGTFDRLEPIAKSLLAVRPYAPVMMTVAPNTAKFYAQGVI